MDKTKDLLYLTVLVRSLRRLAEAAGQSLSDDLFSLTNQTEQSFLRKDRSRYRCRNNLKLSSVLHKKAARKQSRKLLHQPLRPETLFHVL